MDNDASEITIEDFQRLDLRIGKVKKAEVPAWSHWVIKLTVDFGPEIGELVIFSGIMKFFKSEDLEGKQFPFVVNLKPKKIGPNGDVSEGMMIMATVPGESQKEEDETPVLLKVSEKVPNGTKVR